MFDGHSLTVTFREENSAGETERTGRAALSYQERPFSLAGVWTRRSYSLGAYASDAHLEQSGSFHVATLANGLIFTLQTGKDINKVIVKAGDNHFSLALRIPSLFDFTGGIEPYDGKLSVSWGQDGCRLETEGVGIGSVQLTLQATVYPTFPDTARELSLVELSSLETLLFPTE